MKVRHLDGSGETDLRYLIEDLDRHGNVRIYFRRPGGKKVRLREPLGSPEFFAEYRRAFAGQTLPDAPVQRVVKRRAAEFSVRWLFERYMIEDEEYGRCDNRTRRVRKLILDGISTEKIDDEYPFPFGEADCRDVLPKMVRYLRDRKKDAPEAGNSRVKALRQVFKFAIKEEICASNPAREVDYIKTGSEGFHTWDMAEVRKYEERHPIGTKPRLALALLLFLGVRRSDVIALGKQHVRDAVDMPEDLQAVHTGRWLKYTQHKNRNKKPVTLTIPILPELEEVLAASPKGDVQWLLTQFNKPFTAAGFGNWFRDQCDAAGLHHCSAHGLRKAGATIAAENGATPHQLMSIFGWRTLKEAERYTRQASQQRMAAGAMAMIVPPKRRTK